MNLYNYGSTIVATPALPSISVGIFSASPAIGNLCKVIITPRGQLKYAIKANNTSSIYVWNEQATVILGNLSDITKAFTARIVEYTVPAGTIITKLEIVSGTGGTVIATYPPW